MSNDSIDYGSDKIATHLFLEGGETKHTERISPGAGVLTFDWLDAVEVTANGLISGLSIETEGKGRIVVAAKSAGAAGLTFSFRIVYYSELIPSTGCIIGLSANILSALTNLDDGGSPAKRFAPVAVFGNDVGAKSVKVFVESIVSSGAMDFGLGAF